jgi:hypothetical protein
MKATAARKAKPPAPLKDAGGSLFTVVAAA